MKNSNKEYDEQMNIVCEEVARANQEHLKEHGERNLSDTFFKKHLNLSVYRGSPSSHNVKATEWIPYLILSEEEFSYNVLKDEDFDIWDIVNWENTYFLEIRDNSGEIMGRCICAYPLDNPDELHLFALYVAPMFRRQGVTNSLLRYAETLGTSLTLSTRFKNMKNILEKSGYVEIERKVSKYSNLEETKYIKDTSSEEFDVVNIMKRVLDES